MVALGTLPDHVRELLLSIRQETAGLVVSRREPRRADALFPTTGDLERELEPILKRHSFVHHVPFRNLKTGERFEYDFFRGDLGVAIEVTGYGNEDEAYATILKFHVHPATHVGVVLVPRWKRLLGKATDTSYQATLKALEFAKSHMRVDALVAFPYEWTANVGDRWTFEHREDAPGSL